MVTKSVTAIQTRALEKLNWHEDLKTRRQSHAVHPDVNAHKPLSKFDVATKLIAGDFVMGEESLQCVSEAFPD